MEATNLLLETMEVEQVEATTLLLETMEVEQGWRVTVMRRRLSCLLSTREHTVYNQCSCVHHAA